MHRDAKLCGAYNCTDLEKTWALIEFTTATSKVDTSKAFALGKAGKRQYERKGDKLVLIFPY